jgi:mannose/cellobiose epimerase-like protein (N-acyl-D-glucosamine 2-epimerase family)
MTLHSLRACSDKAREWLLDAAFPFWFDKGIDPGRGGFVDVVGVDGTSVPNAPKRTFVQARQVYAFAMAGRLGWAGRWREAVATGLDTIERHCRHPEGGFIHRLDAQSAPDEMRRDLYDQAFVAFAKAHAAVALDRPALADEARAIFDGLDRDWLRPPAGYWEGELPDSACRRQNPHMHLFEAALAIARTTWATDDDLARCNRLAHWFSDYFFDRERAALPEYFDQSWAPVKDGGVFLVEPGHHFEWVWLLGELRALGGHDLAALSRPMWRFGDRYGTDRSHNVAIDEIDSAGRVRSSRARLWPQTERIKAALAMAEAQGSPAFLAEAVSAFEGLQPFLATPMQGAFFDKMLPDGGFVVEPARASSLYHIVCAYSELCRAAAGAA